MAFFANGLPTVLKGGWAEYVLGGQTERAGGGIVQVIGLVRLKAKIELRDLTYKLDVAACWWGP